MSLYIKLPCGCKITDTSVLSMCLGHYHELRAARREVEELHDRMEKMLKRPLAEVLKEKP